MIKLMLMLILLYNSIMLYRIFYIMTNLLYLLVAMGCEVVSVYDDQVAGVLGYPQTILHDLHHRDYATSSNINKINNNHQYAIIGFTQSYILKNLYTYTLNNQQNQYFVYVSGRFLIIAECPDISKQIKLLMHEDRIVALDVKGKLCVTGTVGGRILLWDLQYFQVKTQIKMPKNCVNFSSISLTNNYIFCTDTSQPKNYCFCFDYRTSKLLAGATLGSFQPTLKGKNWLNNHHVTVAADGIWFSRYSASQKDMQVTKGMFRMYPKTSMTCLQTVDETYVLTGSVDGYIFLWAHYQCQKVLKVGDESVSELCLHKNHLIVSNFSENIRVYSYEIIKKNLDPKKQADQAQIKNGQITKDFISVILDSYDRSPLQSLCISKLQPLVYYAQTRNGIFYNKMIPSANIENKMLSYGKYDKKFIEFQSNALKCFYEGHLWSMVHTEKYILVKKIPIPTQLYLAYQKPTKRYGVSFKKNRFPQKCIITLIPSLMKVCLVNRNKILSYDLQEITENKAAQNSIESQMSHVQLSGDFQLISKQAIEIKIMPSNSIKKLLNPQESRQMIDQKLAEIKKKKEQQQKLHKIIPKKQVEVQPEEQTVCIFEDGINAGHHRERLRVIGLMSFVVKEVTYLLILFDFEYMLLEYSNGEWKSKIDEQYDEEVIRELIVEGQSIKIEQRNGIYRRKIELEQDRRNWLSLMHCEQDIDDAFERDGKIVTMSHDSLIIG